MLLSRLSPQAWFVAATVSLMLISATGAVVGVAWYKNSFYVQEVRDIAPRYERFAALKEQQEEILRAAELQNARLEGLVFPADDDPGRLRARLQQQISNGLEAEGMEVTRMRADSEDAGEGQQLGVITIDVSFQSKMPELKQALDFVQSYQPQLFIEQLQLQNRRGRAALEEQIIQGEMTIVGFYHNVEVR